MRKIFITTFLTFAVFIIGAGADAQTRKAPKPGPKQEARPATPLSQARADLIKATTEYKASLEKLIEMYEKNMQDANEKQARKKELFAAGIISKRELEEGEKSLSDAQVSVTQAKKQIAEADDLVAESSVMDTETLPAAGKGKLVRIPAYVATSAYIRYNGATRWTIADAAKVTSFYQGQFGHSLPVSAYGQTATHDRLGFDHRNSVDVAVHPDSAQGQALIAYLKSAGIPFLAFRHAISGSATGAHIHIGYPSHRITASDLSR
jgi:hypothetical protein